MNCLCLRNINKTEEDWRYEEIVLLRKPTISSYEPLVLRDEESVGISVIGIFIKVIS